MLALLLASTSTALRPNTIAPFDPCFGHETSAKQAAPFVEKVWRLIRWQREKPKPSTVRAYRGKLRCTGPENRRVLKRIWREAKRAFYRHRRHKVALQEYLDAITPPGAAVLAAIRACESGGVYTINTDNGFYGAYQFTLSTWLSVGGSGYPHEASPREQDERAARLYREAGPGPWPVCGV